MVIESHQPFNWFNIIIVFKLQAIHRRINAQALTYRNPVPTAFYLVASTVILGVVVFREIFFDVIFEIIVVVVGDFIR